MATRQLQNLAKAVLGDRGCGANVSNQLAASCRRIINGQGSESDAKAVRDYYGVKRSGASGLKSMRRGTNEAFNVANQINLALNGTDSATRTVAQTNLVFTLTAKVEKTLKNKWVRSIANDVGVMLGNNPSWARKFLIGMGRGLRLGGAVGAIAMAGVEVAGEFIDSRRRAGESEGRMADAGRRFNSPQLARDLMNRASQSAERARNQLINGFMARMFGSTWTEYAGNEDKQQQQQIFDMDLKTHEDARQVAIDLGVNVEGALKAKAKAKGTSVSFLSEKDRNEAIDDEIDAKLNSKENSDAALKYAETKFSLQGKAWTDAGNRQLKDQYIAEYQKSLVLDKKQLRAEQDAKAQVAREDPAQRAHDQLTAQLARQEFGGMNSRRQWSGE